jgi:4-oxalocrotonate tautomerase
MPYINVKVAGPLTAEQKKEIAREFSGTLERVAGKKPSTTYIVFDEVDRENWAVGGALLSETR